VIKGQASPETIYTRLGTDVHDIIEDHQREPFDSKEMLDRFASCWDTYPDEFFTDEAFKQKMWDRAMKSFETYLAMHPTLNKIPFAMEQKIVFSVAEDMPNVSITMDRLDEVDGKLELLDWKTGKVMVGKQLFSDLQAPLYIHAVREEFGMDVRRFKFIYLNEVKTRVFEQVSHDEYVCTVGKKEYGVSIRETIREVNRVFSKIKNHEFNVPNDTKGMFFTCKMCAQKANGSCKGADEQAWSNSKGGWAI
jgi:RecB family exonuclease